MQFAANATRMELLRIKKRLVLAHRGHKLLKDKQDVLMRHFFELVDTIRGLRKEVEAQLRECFRFFLMSRMETSRLRSEEALMVSNKKWDVAFESRQVLNLQVPVIVSQMEGNVRSYGFAHTSGNLDLALQLFETVLPKLLELAQAEKGLSIIGDDIERTRRRVNALEYILIPGLEETRRYIEIKLNEVERGNLTRLMKVKEMIREE
jgi:V/A-type H+-transporting ATPase subunit D